MTEQRFGRYGPPKKDWTDSVGEVIGVMSAALGAIMFRAIFIMFAAAVISKRFDVFAAIGYVESLAWAMLHGLVRSLLHRDEQKK